jgi:hypothetical protein
MNTQYALRPAAPKPLFVRAMEYLGKLQIETRKIERWSIWWGVCVCTAAIRVADSLWLLDSFILMNIYSFCTVWFYLSLCLFLIFQFFICVVHIRPDLWPACGESISPTFSPFILSSKSMTFSTPQTGHPRHGLFFYKTGFSVLLKMTMTYPGFEPATFGVAVSIANHYTNQP